MIEKTLEDWAERLVEEIDLDLYQDMTREDTMYDILYALRGMGWSPPEPELPEEE